MRTSSPGGPRSVGPANAAMSVRSVLLSSAGRANCSRMPGGCVSGAGIASDLAVDRQALVGDFHGLEGRLAVGRVVSGAGVLARPAAREIPAQHGTMILVVHD